MSICYRKRAKSRVNGKVTEVICKNVLNLSNFKAELSTKEQI